METGNTATCNLGLKNLKQSTSVKVEPDGSIPRTLTKKKVIILIKSFSKIMTRMQSKIAHGGKHREQAPSERADYRHTPTKTSDTGIIRDYNTIKK